MNSAFVLPGNRLAGFGLLLTLVVAGWAFYQPLAIAQESADQGKKVYDVACLGPAGECQTFEKGMIDLYLILVLDKIIQRIFKTA